MPAVQHKGVKTSGKFGSKTVKKMGQDRAHRMRLEELRNYTASLSRDQNELSYLYRDAS